MPSIVSTDQITDPKKTLAAEIDSALAKFRRCSLYVLASIFTPPDNQDLALFGS